MRLKIIWIIITLFFSTLTLRLWLLQIVHGNQNFIYSEENRIKLIPIDAPRGIIYDRNLEPLVINRPSFNIFIIPEEIIKYPKSINRISKMLEIDPKIIWQKVIENRKFGFLPIKIKKDISKKQVAEIEENSIYLKGVYISADAIRQYVRGNFASHLLGYVGQINKIELERLKIYDYKLGDIIGKDGIEQSYDQYLKGIKGGEQVEISASGRHERILSRKDSIKGNDLVLTLDSNIQQAVEDVMDKETGVVIVMNPSNGEILGLVSKPSFNPNIFVDYKLQKELILTLKDTINKPILNRAIKSAYSPGSIFKLIIGLAGLEKNLAVKDTYINCPGWFNMGRIFHCWNLNGHQDQNIIEAIKNSCNVYFYTIGNKLGVSRIENFACLFGFGKETGISIRGEIKGVLPSEKWKKEKLKQNWYTGDTINLSIGQGFLTVTPIQLVTSISGILNNGIMYQPKLVKRIIDNNEQSFKPFYFDSKKIDLKKSNVELIKKGMFAVVNDPNGTGRLAKIQGIEVSGKTGTVQVTGKENLENFVENNIPWKLRNHAWFICFAPFEKPEIAMVVFIEHGGSGGHKAAVVSHDILSKIYEKKIKEVSSKEKNA